MPIIIPESPRAWLIIAAFLAIAVAGAVGIALYQWLRPPVWKKLVQDERYCQALNVYAEAVQHQDQLCDVRPQALAMGSAYLMTEHGIPAEEAAPNLRCVVAVYARDQSYGLRYEAVAYEQADAYDVALDYYQRAAWWQEDHDPKDYQFLQRCIARVRGKVSPK
jgi:tetratricopeptide (TPR) repeat protein